MSDYETAARPYSKAIFELANEQDSLQLWSEVLQLAAMVAADEDMQAFIASPSILSTQRSEMFLSVMSAADDAPEIDQQVKNMIALLAENDRLLALPAIQLGYQTLKQAAQGTLEVKVTSARKLTIKQNKQMVENLQRRLGKEVKLSAEIDKSLIAGAVIQAGDLVIDGSARGRLNKLTTLLNK